MQARGVLGGLQRGRLAARRSEQEDLAGPEWKAAGRNCRHIHLPARRPAAENGVHGIPVLGFGIADIARSHRLGPGERASPDFGRALTVNRPCSGGVDSFAGHIQKRPEPVQNVLLLLRDGSIRQRRDVQQQIASLADVVDERVYLGVDGVVPHPLRVAPARRADRVVGEPVRRRDVSGTTAFVVVHLALVCTGGGRSDAVLCGGHHIHPRLGGRVVVVGKEVCQIGVADLVEIEVLPDHVGQELVDELFQLAQPDRLFLRLGQLAEKLLQGGVALSRRILVVAGEIVGSVLRHEQFQAFLAYSVSLQLPQVQLRSIGHRVPRVDLAVPHGESVVVLCHRSGEPSARVSKQLRPRVGIPVAPVRDQLWRELRELARLVVGAAEEIVVRPVSERIAVRRHVVLVLGGIPSLVVHVSRVPLRSKFSHAERAPVIVNAELRILEPLGCRIVRVE